MDIFSENIIEINIKNINNIYEVYFNKCIYISNSIKVYEGVNITTKEKLLIEIYNYDIIFFAKRLKNKIIKIEHPNIINIIDIIIESNDIYFIKPFIKKTIRDVKLNIHNIFKEIIRAIKYLFDKNIDIDYLTTNNIYYDDNDKCIKISPFFNMRITQNKILYGSPLYSPPEIIINIKNEKEETLVYNIGVLLYQLYFNNYEIKDYKNILYDLDDTNELYDVFMNIFHKNTNRCSIIHLYEYFNSYIKKKSKNIRDIRENIMEYHDIFFLEM